MNAKILIETDFAKTKRAIVTAHNLLLSAVNITHLPEPCRQFIQMSAAEFKTSFVENVRHFDGRPSKTSGTQDVKGLLDQVESFLYGHEIFFNARTSEDNDLEDLISQISDELNIDVSDSKNFVFLSVQSPREDNAEESFEFAITPSGIVRLGARLWDPDDVNPADVIPGSPSVSDCVLFKSFSEFKKFAEEAFLGEG